ncbi:MAG: asparagine synthase (glutamine-hydrolyzing) [Acidobacteria bacterium]|nr:asparagine synthase (glutamine-hydrolyzing) [Acidobacteriota bacterium]
MNEILARAMRALQHRGPDDEGTEILPLGSLPGQCAALGNRRLAVLDLSPAAHQPMHDPVTGNWLVFNGEIANFRDIRAELERAGRAFSSSSDTEVLLKAFGEWGEACVERLRGMFAFGVWNPREEKLFLARDRLGIKPLYYYQSGDLLAFGSEVRALTASGLVPRKLCWEGLASYLMFGAVQGSLTMYEGVRTLLPGQILTWERGQCRLRTYWDIAEVAGKEPATDSIREAVKAVREILLESVSQALVSDVPLGLFLSGGVDSSSVLALASESREKALETFSVVFAEAEHSEAEYSDLVAKAFGSRHHRIPVDEKLLLDQVPAALDSMDQPTMDGFNTYVLSKAVRRAGVTVALSGLGGDEIFAGYSGSRLVPRMLWFDSATPWRRSLLASLEGFLPPLETSRVSKLLALATGNYPGSHPYFLYRTLFLPSNVRRILPPTAPGNLLNSVAESLLPLVASVRPLEAVNQVSVLEGATYMANMLLRDKDAMGMAHSLEVRVPLVDHKLWEYVLPLPGKLKLDSRLPKPLLVKAVGSRLPPQVYMRPKRGFELPFDRWLRTSLRPMIEKEMKDDSAGARGPLAPGAASAVWDSFLRGKTSWSRPWSLFVLKQWARRNLDRAS